MAVAFGRVLRGAGLRVPLGHVLTFVDALGRLRLDSRDDVYWAGRATLLRNPEDIPVYTAAPEVLTRLTGFHLTRGMLCAMRRPALRAARSRRPVRSPGRARRRREIALPVPLIEAFHRFMKTVKGSGSPARMPRKIIPVPPWCCERLR